MNICKICGNDRFVIVYEGHIRTGSFGDLAKTPSKVYECSSCHVIALSETDELQINYYESDAYRKEVDGTTEVQDYFRLHDGEQARQFAVTGTALFRDRIVADVGCGAGSFLDYIKNVSAKAIAIEPSDIFRSSLAKRGYSTYPYALDAINDWRNGVDIVVSFSVVEHIENPVTFLREIRDLLKPGGKLILSTPNADDLLLHIIPDVYAPFFYRKAHVWYFNSTSLVKLLKIAGFSSVNVIPYHRFGFSNFVTWIRDKSPRGDLQLGYFDKTLDTVWKNELEKNFFCDYLYAITTKDNDG